VKRTDNAATHRTLDGVVTGRVSRRHFLQTASAGVTALLVACGAPVATEAPVQTTTAAQPTTAGVEPAATAVGAADSNVAVKIAPTAAASPNGWTANMPPPPKKYDPVLTITQNFALNGATKFINDETVEDNVTSRWLRDQMGIYFEPKWAAQSGDAVEQNWATTLASGDLPDFMVMVGQENYTRLKRADQLEDITEAWERLASPLLKEKKEYPDGPLWRRFKQPDGSLKIDAIPWSGEIATNDTLLWMRKDWLDKVGLSIPKTVDEVAAAARAFKDQGLAKIGINLSSELRDAISGVDFLFAAYDSMPTYWLKGADGTLVYGSIQPGVKEALGVLRQWYADGLINPEFITIDGGKSTEAVAANQVGIFSGPYWIPNWPLPDARTNDPSGEWIFVDNPAGPNGSRGRALTPIGTTVQAFRKGVEPEKIEAVILNTNWHLERFLKAFETQDYWNCPCQGYGMIFENYDYAWDNDKLVLGPSGTTGPWAYEGGREHTWLYPNVLKDYFDNLATVQAKGESTLNAMERYLALDPIQRENAAAYDQIYKTLDTAIANEFIGTPTETMLQAGANLGKLEDETFIGIITGEKPLDAFDQFVSDWRAQGGDVITEEVNAQASGV
jgi:putative aldouronate transport system substrate-binding protein